jgi:hypothetical protein
MHRSACRACAEVCDACADSCEKLAGMAECAKVCRACARSCRALAGGGKCAGSGPAGTAAAPTIGLGADNWPEHAPAGAVRQASARPARRVFIGPRRCGRVARRLKSLEVSR